MPSCRIPCLYFILYFIIYLIGQTNSQLSITTQFQGIAANYNRQTDNWHIIIPNMFNSDLIVPLVYKNNPDASNDVTFSKYTCEELTNELVDSDLFIPPSISPQESCSTLLIDFASDYMKLQDILGDPYQDASVLVSLGEGITLKRQSDIIRYHTANFTKETYNIAIKILFVSKLDSLFAVHEQQINLILKVPEEYMSATLNLQHECAARGFKAPTYSSLDLQTYNNEEYCVWQCRPLYIRSPWSSTPPLKEHNTTNKMCRQLPTIFTAATFKVEFETSLSSPVPAQFSQRIYDDLNLFEAAMEANLEGEKLTNPIVVMKVDGGKYQDKKFSSLINEVTSMTEDDYVILKRTEGVNFRRLLTSHVPIIVEGLFITSNIRVPPATISLRVAEVIQSTTIPNEGSTAPILLSVLSVNVLDLHHNTPSVQVESNLLIYSLVAGSVVFVIIAIIIIYLNLRPKSQKH